MGNFFDLHRHDEFSNFDGFGKPSELAQLAKELGYQALGISNHGNTSGLVEHYFSCKEAGIKPIMGVEAYFQPKFNKDKKRYHLCLFAKNLQGYMNINRIMSEANINNFYYKPVVDFKLLEKYNDGIICSSACIASAFSQAIVNRNYETCDKLLKKFKQIFGKDFYVEIQPYALGEVGLQEKVNLKLMGLARENKIKCILTSDSHFGRKEDFPTYCKMHEIGKTTLDVKNTYGERYMPTESEIMERFAIMYKNTFKRPYDMAEHMVDNMKEIYNKVEDDILEGLELHLPKISNDENFDSHGELLRMVKNGLKRMGKYNKKYIQRCKNEIEVIKCHGFEDYFLMVQEYVNWAREHGIEVGPGRGSACNCLVACAIGITSVDSIKYDLDFSRFMRKDKKKLPDIDVDFETDRRHEVIEHIMEKYKGKAVQICSYGLYKEDNLLNDLFKVCGVDDDSEKKDIKDFIKGYMEDGNLNKEEFENDALFDRYNRYYDDICIHFEKLLKKMRFVGTHAAGVAVVGTNLEDYTAICKRGDKYSTAYDLNDLEKINVVKFDILGLKTMSETREMRESSGKVPPEDYMEEPGFYDEFRNGNTDGIFQLEKSAPKNILNIIHTDCMNDIIATNALNRPGPLSLKMPQQYAENKMNLEEVSNSKFYEYTKDTYGTILYQEQIVAIAIGIGGLSYQDSYDILKMMKGSDNRERMQKQRQEKEDNMRRKFIEGASEKGFGEQEASEIFDNLIIYSFNKGHATGYSLIATEQMWYKIHCPVDFWFVKMKYAGSDADRDKYTKLAVKSGEVVFLPHVNYTGLTSIRKVDGQKVIQLGTSTLKGVGDKAAKYIETERRNNGRFKDYDDFYDRCKSRVVTSRVIDILYNQGALEFNKKKYERRVIKYNSALYGR